MYMEMMSLLDQYEKGIYSKWCDGLENACLINLNQPLLTRSTLSGLIAVNFNPKVINVMFPMPIPMLLIVETTQVNVFYF